MFDQLSRPTLSWVSPWEVTYYDSLAVEKQQPEGALKVPLMSSRAHCDHHARLEQLGPRLQALDLRHTRCRAAGQRHLHRASPAHQRHQLAALKVLVQHRARHARAEHAPRAQRPVVLCLLPVCTEAGVHVLVVWHAQPRASQSGTAFFENLTVSK